MKISKKDYILYRVAVSSCLCFHCVKSEVDQHQLANSVKETILRSVFKQPFNVFKLCCKWGIRSCLLYDFLDAYCIDYEPVDSVPVNWTMAVNDDEDGLAKIDSIGELCEAQRWIKTNQEYWTALRLDNMGKPQWGLRPNNPANVSKELLDKTQPADRCYVISRSKMKLMSRKCDSLHAVLTSYVDGK